MEKVIRILIILGIPSCSIRLAAPDVLSQPLAPHFATGTEFIPRGFESYHEVQSVVGTGKRANSRDDNHLSQDTDGVPVDVPATSSTPSSARQNVSCTLEVQPKIDVTSGDISSVNDDLNTTLSKQPNAQSDTVLLNTPLANKLVSLRKALKDAGVLIIQSKDYRGVAAYFGETQLSEQRLMQKAIECVHVEQKACAMYASNGQQESGVDGQFNEILESCMQALSNFTKLVKERLMRMQKIACAGAQVLGASSDYAVLEEDLNQALEGYPEKMCLKDILIKFRSFQHVLKGKKRTLDVGGEGRWLWKK